MAFYSLAWKFVSSATPEDTHLEQETLKNCSLMKWAWLFYCFFSPFFWFLEDCTLGWKWLLIWQYLSWHWLGFLGLALQTRHLFLVLTCENTKMMKKKIYKKLTFAESEMALFEYTTVFFQYNLGGVNLKSFLSANKKEWILNLTTENEAQCFHGRNLYITRKTDVFRGYMNEWIGLAVHETMTGETKMRTLHRASLEKRYRNRDL